MDRIMPKNAKTDTATAVSATWTYLISDAQEEKALRALEHAVFIAVVWHIAVIPLSSRKK